MNPEEYVQPIAVCAEDYMHAVAASAAASVMSMHRTIQPFYPNWKTYLDGSFVKTVRKAKPADLTKLALELPGEFARVQGTHSTAIAYAGIPVKYKDLPPAYAKLQVQGTDFPKNLNYSGWCWQNWNSDYYNLDEEMRYGIEIYLDRELEMSAGKASAQAAHAAMSWMLNQKYLDCSFPKYVRVFNTSRSFMQGSDFPIKIVDEGRTEIAPNSLTAIAF